MQEMGRECNSHAVRHMKIHVSTPIVDAYSVLDARCKFTEYLRELRALGTGLAVSNPSRKNQVCCCKGTVTNPPKN